MKQYGHKRKHSDVPISEFASEHEAKKRLITDFFPVQKENSAPHLLSNSHADTKNPEKVQFFLDLGQPDILFRECSECGMKFDCSFPSEINLHQRFHKFSTIGMQLLFHQSDVIGRHGKYNCVVTSGQRREELMELVNSELNAVDLIGNELVYALVDGNKKLCSVLIIEKDLPPLSVSRIWTRKDLRRKGLARYLLTDVAEMNNIEASNIRFSAPTDVGKAFARSFTGSANDESFIY